MNRYDPFAKNTAKPDSTKAAPPRHEEDMLFATGEPVKQAPPADSSWELLNEEVDNLLPNAGALQDAEQFAHEILGEDVPAPAQRTQPQRAPEPAASPLASLMSTPGGKPAPASPRAVAAPRVAVRTLPAAETPVLTEGRAKRPLPQPVQTVQAVQTVQRPPARRSGAGRHAPQIVLAVGATAAAWLALMQRNYVLGAIVGCATIVGVVFAWLWRRR